MIDIQWKFLIFQRGNRKKEWKWGMRQRDKNPIMEKKYNQRPPKSLQ